MWVTESRMLCSLPRSCLVHPIDRFGSEGRVQLWSGDIFNCVSCFLVKKHAAVKWKDAISGFPVSPGSADALARWGGKIKYVLIAHFLGNIYAKNCHNRTVYVKIIASQRWDVFWDTVYSDISETKFTESGYRNSCTAYRLVTNLVIGWTLAYFSGKQSFSTTDISHTFCRRATTLTTLGSGQSKLSPNFVNFGLGVPWYHAATCIRPSWYICKVVLRQLSYVCR